MRTAAEPRPGYTSRLTWGHILVRPLEEAALLLSWLGACVELAPLVGPVLLHRPGDGGLAAQARRAPSAVIARSAKPTPAMPRARRASCRAT